MSTIHLHQTTTLTPDQYVAGLTDFGPGRSKLFGNSADEYLKVHSKGTHDADVTEGSGGIWGAIALRLVRSQACRPHNDQLQHVNRPRSTRIRQPRSTNLVLN